MKVGNGLFQFTVYSPSPKEIRIGARSRNLETGTKTGAMDEWCLLVYSLWIALLTSLYSPGRGPGVVLCIVGCTLPHQSLIKIWPADLPIAQCNEVFFKTEVPSSQITLFCVIVTKSNQHKKLNTYSLRCVVYFPCLQQSFLLERDDK